MPTNRDYSDLLSIFNAEGVEYLIVGAYAVMFYAEPRYTRDLDIWVNPTPENAARIYRALAKFGAPLRSISVEDFCNRETIYQIGVAPNRIDIVMSVAGVEFEEAWKNRTESTYGGIPIHILGKEDVIRAKKACGRPQDLLDLNRLES